jgi:hypothetical protein
MERQTTMRTEFISPRAHRRATPHGLNRLESLEGVTLGLLCNSKPNAQLLLDVVADEVGERVRLNGIFRTHKAVPSEGAPPEVYTTLAERCGAVIFATAD